MRNALIEFYLNYRNNYLTLDKLAEHYDLDPVACYFLIEAGEIQHEENVKRLKAMEGDI